MLGDDGHQEPDPDLRDNENVPLPAMPVSWVEDPTERFATLEYCTAVDDYMRDEVLPHVPDAWVDYDKTKVGYEIPLTRHFYKYVPPRPLEEIDAEIKALEDEIQRLLAEVLPPDERPIMKWNGNPFRIDGGNGGRTEDDGSFLLLPYWMGRYLGILSE